MTTLAMLSLVGARSTDPEAQVATERGVAWLAPRPQGGDAQFTAMQLVLWRRVGRSTAEVDSLVKVIKERQNPDGGWRQDDGMPSDAWATGQALLALAESGLLRTDDVVARGRSYLAKTQKEDGSWEMTSRPSKPSNKGAESLIPITGGGSAWAVLGLVVSQ